MELYYTAIDDQNVDEMIRYTYANEPEGRINYLRDYFENDFEVKIVNLEVLYEYPSWEFDNSRYIKDYDVSKAVIVRADFVQTLNHARIRIT